ncbi:unnamed protein product [Urochloa humidicola]
MDLLVLAVFQSVNGGLYVVHYARSSDSQALYFDLMEPSDSNLSEARADPILVICDGWQPWLHTRRPL